MSKIGRNDPCPCGSGKKYKHCCINKEITYPDDNDLFRISRYGSTIYKKDELDNYSRFFIETTASEKFEIWKAGQGYSIKDIVPPELTMHAKDYRTIEFNDIQRQRLLKHNPDYDFLNIGKHKYFDGVVEGGYFNWERSEGFTSSKGTISKLYIRQNLRKFILNINLFPQKEEFKSADEFLDTSGLSIYTETSKLDFICNDGKLYFEGIQVLAILSILDKESLSKDEMLSNTPTEYNVSCDIVIGRPLFIIKFDEQGMKVSVINEKVVDITALQQD